MPKLWYTTRDGLSAPLCLRTQDLAKGCGDVAPRRAEGKTAGSVLRMTLSVVSLAGNRTLPGGSGCLAVPVSGRVNLGGVHQHDRDVVLNGVHTSAFSAFQTGPVCAQDHRLLAKRADQDVKQILRNHRDPYCTAGKMARNASSVRPVTER